MQLTQLVHLRLKDWQVAGATKRLIASLQCGRRSQQLR